MNIQQIDRRIARALRLLEQHVREPIDYSVIASAIDLSVHRFHHLFAEEMGETRGEDLRRIRLEAAATRLRWTHDSVGQVAAMVATLRRESPVKHRETRWGHEDNCAALFSRTQSGGLRLRNRAQRNNG
jgi:methylphosphotriester-DNA--protein-cysteine methyltransferase